MKTRNFNISSKPNHSQIEGYFNFSNPNWKKRHSSFLIFETFNLAIIIAFLILCTLTNIWKITLVTVSIVIFIITIILFLNKKSSYRYLSYILVSFGMVFVIYVQYFMDIPQDSYISEHFIFVLSIIIAIIDFIFLLNYISIEYSQGGFFPKMYSRYKVEHRAKFGTDEDPEA